MTTSVFGNIFVASQLEDAAVGALVRWFPTYLREVERVMGLDVGVLPMPKNFTNRNSFDALPGESIPKVVVISEGIQGVPVKNNGSQYRAMWQLAVGVAVAAKDEVVANTYVKCYGAAVRAMIEQQQSLGGNLPIAEIHWVGETYPDLPIQDQISIYKAANVEFLVEVEDVVTKWAGPREPSEAPIDYGAAQEVVIEIIRTGLDITGPIGR